MKNDKITFLVQIDKSDYKTLLRAFKQRTKPESLITIFKDNITPYLQYFVQNLIDKQEAEEEREKVLLNKKGSNELEPKENTDQLSAEELEELKRLLGGN